MKSFYFKQDCTKKNLHQLSTLFTHTRTNNVHEKLSEYREVEKTIDLIDQNQIDLFSHITANGVD